MNFKFKFNKNSKFPSNPNMRKTKKEKEEIKSNNNSDRSYLNFQFLKKINRDFVNDIHIPKYLYTNSCNTDNNSDINNKSITKNKKLYDQYEYKRAKELKNIISKMSNIIKDEYNEEDEEDEEDEDSKYSENSNDDRSYYNLYTEIRKPNKSNSYQYEKKEKVLKQFNKDLLNLSSLLEKKKAQLKNRENRVKRQELKIKSVLTEFDQIVNDDRVWKKDLEDIRNDFQSSIDVLNRENKKLLETVQKLSSSENDLKLELNQRELEIVNLKTQFDKAINNIKEKKNREIINLNEKKNKEINNIIEQKNKEIIKFKEQKNKEMNNLLEQKKKEINNLKEQKEKEINNLREQKEKEINNLREQKEKEINNISEQKEKEINNLKEQNTKEINNIKEQKDKEINNIKVQNENITTEKDKANNISDKLNEENNKLNEEISRLNGEISRLNEEIRKLKENMKDMYDTNVELYESCEKLSQKKKENIKRNVSISVKPEFQSIEIQTENSNLLEKIINQQYMDIKKLFIIFHYLLTLYNKNNMSDNEYCVLWNDIRIKFFKNVELKEMKIFNYITYILNYSLQQENINNIFETQSGHFIYLYLEFILDYINQNSLSIEQKFKIGTIILKYGTIKPNSASTATNNIASSSDQISQMISSLPNLTNSKTLLDIPFNKLKKLSLLSTIVSFDFTYDKNSLIYLYLYLITLYCYGDTVETKEDFISLLSEYADNISYILIFVFNGLINELTTSEKRISFINNYGVPILLAYFNSYNKYYIYFSSIILVELFSDNKCQAILLKKFYNDEFFSLCCKILNYNNVNISENICIALQKMASYSEDNTLMYNNQELMETLENLLKCSGYNNSINKTKNNNNNNNTNNNNNNNNNNKENNPTNNNLPKMDENLGILPEYEFMALNILSIFKKRPQK